MRIGFIVEGKTEKAFIPFLRKVLESRCSGNMPRIEVDLFDGTIPVGEKLKGEIDRLLGDSRNPADAVVALTDVYTGRNLFNDAADAKLKMKSWAENNPNFYPHAAQFEFEAWLLPYWTTIQSLAGHNKRAPASNPENVDNMNPPSQHIREIFRNGSKGRQYVKVRDASRILRVNNLEVSAQQCAELKSMLNTFIGLCGGKLI